jgi:hypothetical protein
VDKVRLAGGTIDQVESGVRMYSRAKVTKPFKIRLKFTRKIIPSVTTSNGAFSLLGWVVATNSAPTSIPANWPGTTPTGDLEVAAFLRGFRFNVGNFTTQGDGSNRFRLQVYPGDGTRVQLVTDKVIDLGLNVEQELEFSVSGGTTTLTAVGLGLSQSHTHSVISDMTSGYLMLYTSNIMEAEFGDFRRIS